MRFRNLLAGLLAALLGAAGSGAADEKGYGAIIGRDMARLSFPLPRQEVWKWDEEATRHASEEYGWVVRFTNGRAVYNLSVVHFKRTGVEPGEGSIEDLLEVCQKDLWQEVGRARNRLRGDVLEARPTGRRLDLVVSDSFVLDLLREAGSERMIFETWRKGRLVKQRWVRATQE